MKKEQHIAILGYGTEGRALHKRFPTATILDEAQNPDAFKDLSAYGIVYRSPGIALSKLEHPNISSATKLFFDECPCPIIGVTGTKGKGTTSTLIYEMLKAAGRDVHLGGNIGLPAIEFLDELTPDSLVVLELSSFQLHDLHKSPHIGVVLNVTSEHLDVHKDTAEYRDAKASILKHQGPSDHAIINGDYEGSRSYGQLGQGEKHWVSTQELTEGACIKNEEILVLGQPTAKLSDIALIGPHNRENVLPACLAAKLLNIPNDTIQKTLRSFTGLPHRLELVAEHNNIKFYNDSFSSVPETSIAALKSFKEPMYLIAGGSEKYADFTEWGQAVDQSPNLKKALLIGLTASKLDQAISKKDKIEHTQNLEQTFAYLKDHAQPGDIVVLSPACASFDQFKNYKERGKIFSALAKQWKPS